MKQILSFFAGICLVILTSGCSDPVEEEYLKTTYKIYYPGNTTVKIKYCYCHDVRTSSSKGTNYLIYKKGYSHHFVEDTSAPIEIVSIEKF